MDSVTPEELEKRAFEVEHSRACPHCGGKIKLWDALAMVNGSAVRYVVQVFNVQTKQEQILYIDQVRAHIHLIPEDR